MEEWRFSRENIVKFILLHYLFLYNKMQSMLDFYRFTVDFMIFLRFLFFGGELIFILTVRPASPPNLPTNVLSPSGCGWLVVEQSQWLRWVIIMFWVVGGEGRGGRMFGG